MQSSKISVVAILNRLDIGGTAMNTFPLMNGLIENFNVSILYGDRDSDASVISYYQVNYPHVNIVPVKYLNKSYNIFHDLIAIIIIKNWLKKNNIQIVHTHGSKAGFVGRIAAYFSKSKIKIHTYHGHFFHSYFGKIKTRLFILLERGLGKITTSVICLSNSQQNEICNVYKIVSAKKSNIITLGIETTTFLNDKESKRKIFRQKYKLTINQIAIGIIGRIAPIKNHHLFIDIAISLLKKNYSHVIFFIVGDGELSNTIKKYLTTQLKFHFGNTNYINHFVFTSWYTEIAEVHNGLDIVVLTSLNEGTPLSIIEAQVTGKPVVVTNAGGTSETLLINKSGFVIEIGNQKMFERDLCKLIDDENLRHQFGEKAIEFAGKQFSLLKQIEETKSYYNKLLAV